MKNFRKAPSLWLLFLSPFCYTQFCYSHAFHPSVISLFSFACNFLETLCQFWTWIPFCGLIQVFSRVLSLVISIVLVDIVWIGFSSLEVHYIGAFITFIESDFHLWYCFGGPLHNTCHFHWIIHHAHILIIKKIMLILYSIYFSLNQSAHWFNAYWPTFWLKFGSKNLKCVYIVLWCVKLPLFYIIKRVRSIVY